MAEIIVDQTDLNINITPNTTQLNVFTGGYACAQGNTTEVQYNNGGVIAGANGLTYTSGTQTTTAANLAVTNDANLGAVGNVTITGGSADQFLKTDGAGGLSFANISNANYAAFAGVVVTNAQPNITSVGNLSNLTVTGNVTANFFLGNGSQLAGIPGGNSISNGTSNVRVLANSDVIISVGGNSNVLVANSTGIQVNRANLGSVANLNITGGNNGFVLQTDGTGNLTWTAMTGSAGNGVVGGSNTQVQYNDGGAFGGTAGFTFNKASNLLNTPGRIVAAGNIESNAYLKGDGGLISNIPGAPYIANGNSNVRIATSDGNITVTVNNTTTTTFANNVINVATTINTNSAINSTVANGTTPFTVTSQTKVANLNADLLDGYDTATANTANTIAVRNADGNISANYFIGNGSQLTGIDTAGIANGNSNIAIIANSNVNISVAGNANIVTVTGTGVNVSGTLNATGNANVGNIGATQGVFTGNISAGNVFANSGTVIGSVLTGVLSTNAQPNITSVGTLTSLGVSGNITAANIIANTGIFAGNGSGLTNINGANVNTVANATYANSANIANTVAINAQPNITSVGTLLYLTVQSNVVAGDLYANSGYIIGNSIIGNTLQGSLVTNAQPNITSVGSLSNLTVTGNIGANNISITSNGTFGNVYANSGTIGANFLVGTLVSCSQPNITSLGLLTYLDVDGNIALSGAFGHLTAVGNITSNNITANNWANANNMNVTSNISAGNVKTDNLLYANGTPWDLTQAAGSNTTIQYNAGGNSLGGSNAFTFNDTTNTVSLTGNLIASYANITNNLVVTANISAGNVKTDNLLYANGAPYDFEQPGGSNTNIQFNDSDDFGGSNAFTFDKTTNAVSLTGNITANYVTGTLTTNSQPNITSIGTLTGLNINGNVTAANIIANTGVFTGNGSGLSAIAGANVTGTVANATHASTANTVVDAAQSNITSVGNLTDLRVNNTKIHLGNNAGANNQGNFSIAIGNYAGQNSQGNTTIAVGHLAGYNEQGDFAIAIGYQAGNNDQGNLSIAIGYQAGLDITQLGAIGIGFRAGNQGKTQSTAIGYNAGSNLQQDGIAIGSIAGINAKNQTVSIGLNAGTGLGNSSIAIGAYAAPTSGANNTITLNATGANLFANTANTFVVKPIRNANTTNLLNYDVTTGEITYGTGITITSVPESNITTLYPTLVYGNGAQAFYIDNLTADPPGLPLSYQPQYAKLVGGNLDFQFLFFGSQKIDLDIANGNAISFQANANANVFVIRGNEVEVNKPLQLHSANAATVANITGAVGYLMAVSDQNGKLAYYDTGNTRWEYVANNSPV